MTKKKKLVKKALKNPEMFSHGELQFFQRWLQERKLRKAEKKIRETELNKDLQT